MPPKRSQASMQPMRKSWCFTLNNPVENEPLLDTNICEYIVYGHEIAPSTGTPHIQGFVVFKDQKRLSAVSKLLPRAFWVGANGTNQQASDYCKKSLKYTEWGALPNEARKRVRDERQTAVSLSALAAPTVREAMDILAKDLPYEYLVHGESMERNLKKRKVVPHANLYPLDSFLHSRLLFGSKATLIWGPTGTGKTCFALAHFKNPLVVSHIDKLKQLSTDNDGIVFDDMSFKHWPKESIIHLLDYEISRDINVRYGTVNIPAGVTKVFTHNTRNPFYDEDNVEDGQKDAIERRLVRVNVVGSLINLNYKPRTPIIIIDSEDETTVDEDVILYGADLSSASSVEEARSPLGVSQCWSQPSLDDSPDNSLSGEDSDISEASAIF